MQAAKIDPSLPSPVSSEHVRKLSKHIGLLQFFVSVGLSSNQLVRCILKIKMSIACSDGEWVHNHITVHHFLRT